MTGFLRSLAPKHPDALRPAAPLRARAVAAGFPAGDDPPDGEAAPPIQPLAQRAQAATAAEQDAAPARPGTLRTAAPTSAPAPAITGTEGSGPATSRRPGTQSAISLLIQRPDEAAPEPMPGKPQPAFAPLTSPVPETPATAPASAAPPLQPSMPAATATAPGARALEPVAARPSAAGAPLSAETVAHAARERSEPPAIHISIDRIEVRAAPQPRKPASSRARPAPQTTSLHDYLRGKSSR